MVRETERQTVRDRDRQRQTDRDRQRQTETDIRERQTETDRERQTDEQCSVSRLAVMLTVSDLPTVAAKLRHSHRFPAFVSSQLIDILK